MSGAVAHNAPARARGRPYEFIVEFKGLGIRPVETTNSSTDGPQRQSFLRRNTMD